MRGGADRGIRQGGKGLKVWFRESGKPLSPSYEIGWVRRKFPGEICVFPVKMAAPSRVRCGRFCLH